MLMTTQTFPGQGAYGRLAIHHGRAGSNKAGRGGGGLDRAAPIGLNAQVDAAAGGDAGRGAGRGGGARRPAVDLGTQ